MASYGANSSGQYAVSFYWFEFCLLLGCDLSSLIKVCGINVLGLVLKFNQQEQKKLKIKLGEGFGW